MRYKHLNILSIFALATTLCIALSGCGANTATSNSATENQSSASTSKTDEEVSVTHSTDEIVGVQYSEPDSDTSSYYAFQLVKINNSIQFTATGTVTDDDGNEETFDLENISVTSEDWEVLIGLAKQYNFERILDEGSGTVNADTPIFALSYSDDTRKEASSAGTATSELIAFFIDLAESYTK